VHGVPKDFDPTGFVGRRLELISFTANTVHFVLEGDYSLTAESSLEHDLGQCAGGIGPIRYEVPVSESGLMQWIGKLVIAGMVERSGTLLLRFEDGQALRLFDDSESYESYKINCAGSEIIV
jgi:hypothetical protein